MVMMLQDISHHNLSSNLNVTPYDQFQKSKGHFPYWITWAIDSKSFPWSSWFFCCWFLCTCSLSYFKYFVELKQLWTLLFMYDYTSTPLYCNIKIEIRCDFIFHALLLRHVMQRKITPMPDKLVHCLNKERQNSKLV